ncbi:MAG: Cobalt-precorrin-5B C(1)-methyltransferase [Methanonatronarchaeales archaeon]|nr:Cobalt-precorrin-5B C(1)-methyltransferase [Methanonatronarchaeales archaeon]
MRDPVNGYELPPKWVEAAGDRGTGPEELDERVSSGWFFLTSQGTLLRRGFTTGTAAAAAAKAAALSLDDEVESVEVPTPSGLRVEINVEEAGDGRAAVVKDAGDHGDDATDGAELVAEARPADRVQVEAGEGIGVATRTVGKLVEGEPAVNPAPSEQIEGSVSGAGSFEISISVTDGASIAQETKNSLLGVEGGISVLGTTGFVEPWCEELRLSLESRAAGAEGAVVTTGRMGAMYSKMLLPDRPVYVFGKHVGRGLETVDGSPVVAGLPGLLLKWGAQNMLDKSERSSWAGALETGERDLLEGAFRSTVERARAIRSDAEVIILNWNGDALYDSREETWG